MDLTGIGIWAVGFLWLVVAAIVGALVGLAIDGFAVRRLRATAGYRGWHLRHAFAASLHGMPEIWGALLGVAIVRRYFYRLAAWEPWISRFWTVVLVLSATVFAVRLASTSIRSYISSDDSKGPSGTIFINITRVAIWAVGLTIVLGAFGIEIGPLVATLGVGGIAISLGLQDTLANLFNGLQITLTKQIACGQFVRLQSGEEGEIVDVNWRDTRLRTSSEDIVIVPNSVIGRSVMTNYSRGQEQHTASVPFTVVARADLDRVVSLAREVATEVQRTSSEADPEFQPSCRVTAVAPDAVTCSASLRVISYRKRGVVSDEFLRALHKRLTAEGIGFAEE